MVEASDQGEFKPYLDLKLQLIPLHRWDAKDAKGRERGKSPRDGAWQKRGYINEEVLAEAILNNTNVGIRLPRTIVVVDVDPRNFPPRRNMAIELSNDLGLNLNAAPHTITGSGGDHYWFTKPADVDLMDSLPDYPGIEFKSHGRQVVAAGSKHPNGNIYRWDELSVPLQHIRPLPERLLMLARRPPPDPGAGFAAGGEMTGEQITELLALLKPEDFRKHDDWRDMMMACHHASNGNARQEFIDWSIQDPAYADQAWTIGRRWDSLHIARPGMNSRQVTVRYIYKHILATGQQIPNAPPEEDFEPVELIGHNPTSAEVDGLHLFGEGEQGAGGKKSLAPMTILERMNARCCVVNESGKFRVFTDQHDPVFNRPTYSRSNRMDFENLMCNQLIEIGTTDDGKTRMMPLGKWWLGQVGRRQYDGVHFNPEQSFPNFLNLWRGWACEPRQGSWGLMKDLLLEVLCDGSREAYDYVLDWAAYMVQRPARPAEVALAFRGEKGTGKGTFGRALTSLAGNHGMHISSPEHLTGRFNSHLMDTIALFADEAFWAGDRSGESVLKQLVTEPTITFEGKGRDAVVGRNMIHIIMASNSDWVVPAGLDGERRFAVFEVNSKAQGDFARFEAVHAEMNRRPPELREGEDDPRVLGLGYSAMLWELMSRPLDRNWAPRRSIPRTTGLLNQLIRSMDLKTLWLFEMLHRGELPGARGNWAEPDPLADKGILVAKCHIRTSMEQYLQKYGSRGMKLPTPIQAGIWLNKMIPELEAKQEKVIEWDLQFGNVPTDVQGRGTFYVFPSLAECREAFELKLGGAPVKWDIPLHELRANFIAQLPEKEG